MVDRPGYDQISSKYVIVLMPRYLHLKKITKVAHLYLADIVG